MKKDTPPPDLELRVRVVTELGRTRLSYGLHSSAGVAPFSHREIAGPVFQGSSEDLHRRLLRQIEELSAGLDVDGALVLGPGVRRKLDGLGRSLWQQLFNDEMRQAYRLFRESVRTLQIISDEPWIPWEMIKPYDDHEPVLDDEFLAERFELTRWLAGNRPPPGEIPIAALACLAPGRGLPQGRAERDFVIGLSRSQMGLQDASPASLTLQELTALLEKDGIGLLHFIGHGTFDAALPNEAAFPLADGSVFRPSDLHGPVQTQIAKNRPLVFLNACSSGRQAWSWTSLGGWADRWVRTCGCGAFLGPQWNVRDSVAFAFARAFYESLTRGETLGKAAKAARQAAREVAPGNPSWLAYAVYGHPNARVIFGEGTTMVPTQDIQHTPRPRKPPLFDNSSPNLQEPLPTIATSVRSSNLRIKQQFTDRDRDRFVEESFNFIADFFESSLAELQQRYAPIETAFRRIDRHRFAAAIYVNGKKESSCRLWLGGQLGDIAYASGDSGPENTYNEALTVKDDGYSLFLQPLGLHFFGSSDRKALTEQAAAEYLWSILIEHLQ